MKAAKKARSSHKGQRLKSMPPASPPTVWWAVEDVMARYRVRSPTTIWDWVRTGLLPQPHHIRQRALWSSAQLAAADARLIRPPRAA